MRIDRRVDQIDLVFEDGEREWVRSFTMKEQSAHASGLFLASLDKVVHEERAAFVPSDRVEEYLFERAGETLAGAVIKLLRPVEGPCLTPADLKFLGESQIQAIISRQCELNDYTEELMGNVQSLLVRVTALRLAGVMMTHGMKCSTESEPVTE